MAPALLDRNGSTGRSFCSSNNRRIAPSSTTSMSSSPHSNYYAMTMMTRSSSSSSRPPPIPEHCSDNDFYVINTPSRASSYSSDGQQLLVVRGGAAGANRHVEDNSSNSSHFGANKYLRVSSFVRTILKVLSFPYTLLSPPACHWLSSSVLGTTTTAGVSRGRPRPQQLLPIGSTVMKTTVGPRLGRKVTGTLFGYRRGHVTFAVQDGPGSDPALLLELAMSTATLVKEMSSGLVRIALECDKSRSAAAPPKLFDEAEWSMYCNGRKCGYAAARRCCNSLDARVLNTVRTVSVGAGVIPATCALEDGKGGGGKDKTASCGEGELLYMRAMFERVVGSRDSEAFYMMNPDGSGGPELSVFLLRL
ncbi:unnamed protein product [Linum tenue]|uniref:Protein MIZU-KUSSEI 1 n=1 Tax=Linum tenue TaxID=586396 RepID=A0AAV0GS78_9ROSI|nr:unnamed protein product [Linum tenue]